MRGMKKIIVVVRNLPLNTRRNAEALRMSVGLTLREDKVAVIFLDDGVYTATPIRSELIHLQPPRREFEALTMLNCPMVADKDSMKKRRITKLFSNIRPVEREEIVRMITESDIVIPF